MDYSEFNDSVITDANYLYDGYLKAKLNSNWKPEVQLFEANYLLEIALLQKELKDGTYKTFEPKSFIINERGKTRLIKGLRMRDRVARHAFCDYVLNPILRPKLIYDNYASLEKRGISMARNRFKWFLQKWFNQHKSNTGWILIEDYSGFYDNILHEVLKEEVGKLLPTEKDKWYLSLILHDSVVDVSYLSEEERKRYKTTKLKILEHNKIPSKLKTGKYF